MVAQLQQYSIGFIVLGIGMIVQGTKRTDALWLLGGSLLLLVGGLLLIYGHWNHLVSLVARTPMTHRGKRYNEHRSPI